MPSKLADEIKRIRKAADLSGADLAARVGIGRSTIYAYESGRRTPTFEVAGSISVACGVPKKTLESLYSKSVAYTFDG
jgi:transcriptional regulator with XRE-family HTH domain